MQVDSFSPVHSAFSFPIHVASLPYLVEPTGSFMGDPNLTDAKYPRNPTKSYRSRQPPRVVADYLDWQGHSPEEIQAMKDAIAGLEPIDG